MPYNTAVVITNNLDDQIRYINHTINTGTLKGSFPDSIQPGGSAIIEINGAANNAGSAGSVRYENNWGNVTFVFSFQCALNQGDANATTSNANLAVTWAEADVKEGNLKAKFFVAHKEP